MRATAIRSLRTAEGLTQERLAESSGVAVRTIQRIEAGAEGSLDTLSALAGALGVPVRELLDPIDDPALRSAMDRMEERDRLRWEAELRRSDRRHRALRVALIAIATVLALALLLLIGVLVLGIATDSTAPVTSQTAVPISGTP